MIRSLSATAKVGALLVLVVAGMLLSSPRSEGALLNQIKKVTASDAHASTIFGSSVATDGNTAIVGAWGARNGGVVRQGAAYILQQDEGGLDNWGETKKLTASDAANGDEFGLTVAIDGDTAIVGAHLANALYTDAGAAYIFQRNEGGQDNWGQVIKLTASDAWEDDQFGKGVAISGDIAIVGARLKGAGGSNTGAAYVFQRDDGGVDNWGQIKKLTASDAELFDLFGASVAVNGDTAVVGALAGGVLGIDTGAVYVFKRDLGGADNWGEVKKLTASDAQPGVSFGESVAVSGDTAIVGAEQEGGAGDFAGAAYVYERDHGGAENWGEVVKLTASDAQDEDVFGKSVAISDDTIVVGAIHQDAGATNGGAAYTFRRNQGGADSWGEVTKLTASDAQFQDSFGSSVAVGGNIVVVGAIHEDSAADNAGAAYVFDLLGPKITPTSTPTVTPTPTITLTPPPPTFNPVGGIAVDTDAGLRPLNEPGSQGRGTSVIAWAIAAVASAATLGGVAWYVRRRVS